MGGNLVLNYALRRQQLPTAAISSSPMIQAVRHPGALYRMLARMLLLVAPNYRLQSTVYPERLMSDPDEQQALRDDELFHSRLSLRLGAALIDSGAWALANAENLGLPTLLTHGTNDVLTCHQASQAFAARSHPRCQLQILEGSLHDPFRGLEREKIIRLFVNFIDQSVSETTR
jgi:alpha-beta hydrolase superfamily lysophospholipase